MSNKEILELVVAKAKSREKKNAYTQGAKRTQVASGHSDCSSFVRWCYLCTTGVDIGLNTAAQIVNKRLRSVHDGGSAPKQAALQIGDLLYFKGTDRSRPLGVGHVEMYIGGGKIIGHGSGTGPTIKDMAAYCASRAKAGKGYIKTLRLLDVEAESGVAGGVGAGGGPGAAPPAAPAPSAPPTGVLVTSPEQVTYPANPMKHPVQPDVRVTGALVNLRTGPGTIYPPVAVVKQGAMLPKVLCNGWRMVEYQGRLLFISETLSEEV